MLSAPSSHASLYRSICFDRSILGLGFYNPRLMNVSSDGPSYIRLSQFIEQPTSEFMSPAMIHIRSSCSIFPQCMFKIYAEDALSLDPIYQEFTPITSLPPSLDGQFGWTYVVPLIPLYWRTFCSCECKMHLQMT